MNATTKSSSSNRSSGHGRDKEGPPDSPHALCGVDRIVWSGHALGTKEGGQSSQRAMLLSSCVRARVFFNPAY